MKNYSVLGIVCKAVAVLVFLSQMLIYGFASAMTQVSPWMWFLQALASLFWPVWLWAFGELLDHQKDQKRKLERILELLGDVEEPEEDLIQLEAQLEEALERGGQPEPEDE